MLAELKDRRIPFLFFANKSDIAGWCAMRPREPSPRSVRRALSGLVVVLSLTPFECCASLGLDDIKSKPWHITCAPATYPRPLGRFNPWAVLRSHCCGLTGEGIEAGVSWLTEKLSRD